MPPAVFAAPAVLTRDFCQDSFVLNSFKREIDPPRDEPYLLFVNLILELIIKLTNLALFLLTSGGDAINNAAGSALRQIVTSRF